MLSTSSLSVGVNPRRPAPRTREETTRRLIARADRLLGRAAKTSAQFTRVRLGIFLLGAAVTIGLFQSHHYQAGNGSLALFLVLFLIVARYHSRLAGRMHRLRLWRGIKLGHLARLRLDWAGIPPRMSPTPEIHPYAVDLDITGTHSLLTLLDTTSSSNGRERLAQWLLDQPPDLQRWVARQTLIRELSRLPLFRDRLSLEASLVGEAELDGSRIHGALEWPAGFPGLVPLLVVEGTLAAVTLSLAVWSAATGGQEYWILSFAMYAAIYLFTTSRTASVFSRALSLHGEMEKLGAIFRALEGRSYGATPALSRLVSPLISGETRPSAYIRRLARVAQALSVRAHPLVHLVLNAVGPWDLLFTYRLEGLRQRVITEVPAWLETLAELEAASALANFAGLNPGYHWPAPAALEAGANGATATLQARALGHPLIAEGQRVTNDLHLQGVGRVLLITGSNMSGKSTFLRTIGINVSLAQAGAPVCAAAFHWSWVRIACCIRVDDSLEAGLSFFYAEVKRLKRLLDAATISPARPEPAETGSFPISPARPEPAETGSFPEYSAPPVLFLIDEIFKGTNNRERLIGSRAYITALTESNGFGLVTTHDLELADMEQEIPHVTNAHFQETVEASALKFDYKLRPGPCPTTNALRIMALEGLPVPKSVN